MALRHVVNARFARADGQAGLGEGMPVAARKGRQAGVGGGQVGIAEHVVGVEHVLEVVQREVIEHLLSGRSHRSGAPSSPLYCRSEQLLLTQVAKLQFSRESCLPQMPASLLQMHMATLSGGAQRYIDKYTHESQPQRHAAQRYIDKYIHKSQPQ